MGRYRMPAPLPLPPNEAALREAALIAADVEAIGQRLKVAPCEALDKAWRLQRKHGPIERISAYHRLANANAAVFRACELAQGGRSIETMAFRLKKAVGLVEEAKVAMMKATKAGQE